MVIIDLSQLAPKQKGTVVRIGGSGSIRQRMMDMGLVNGAEVEVLRVAPLGDPIELSIRGYNLSLRKNEAAAVDVATNPIIPLAAAPAGVMLQIVNLHHGFGFKRRAQQSGLHFGARVRIIPNPEECRKVTLEVEGKQVVIGQGMAQKIFVQLEEDHRQPDE